MSPQQGQLLKGLPHCTQRRELGLEWSCLTYAVRHAYLPLMRVVVRICDFFACSVSRIVLCGTCTHTYSPIMQWVFISHCDMFMILCVT